jgi:hypothetical protein
MYREREKKDLDIHRGAWIYVYIEELRCIYIERERV